MKRRLGWGWSLSLPLIAILIGAVALAAVIGGVWSALFGAAGRQGENILRTVLIR